MFIGLPGPPFPQLKSIVASVLVIADVPESVMLLKYSAFNPSPDPGQLPPRSSFATVKLYVPGFSPVIVVVVPVPVVVTFPGCLVSVQFPDEGRPLNAILPVPIVQVGWVMVPITGVEGLGLIITVVLPSCPQHPWAERALK